MEASSGDYIPAARWRSLNAVYDPFIRLTMRERTFRGALLARILDGPEAHDVLDVGCGTGTFVIQLARALPRAEVTGLDADEDILARARAKAEGAGAEVGLVCGRADALPFPDDSFDRVATSLVFHHLEPSVKRTALSEARRVLRPGCWLHIADWGRPHDLLMRIAFFSVRALDGFSNTRDNVEGRLAALAAEAGFASAEVTGRLRTAFGTLEYVDAAFAERPKQLASVGDEGKRARA